MKIECLAAAKLDHRHCARWRELQHGHPLLDSPQFSVELLQHVAAVREGVEVAELAPVDRARAGPGSTGRRGRLP